MTIDPGKNGCGVATWIDGRLEWAGYCENTDEALASFAAENACTRIVAEFPQVYRYSRKDANKLLHLPRAIGRYEGALGITAEYVRPARWKGQLPKKIAIERIQKSLDKSERERVTLPTTAKERTDVWDAVGIGLWVHGRF